MIINFHPKEIQSKAVAKLIERLLAANPTEVLHAADKTKEEWQAIIKSPESMVFVGPVYWWGMGHDMDKWMQDVLTYNFAFSFDTGEKVGLLDGRAFEIHLTHGTPTQWADTMKKNIEERLKTGIFGYCNSQIEISFYYDKD